MKKVILLSSLIAVALTLGYTLGRHAPVGDDMAGRREAIASGDSRPPLYWVAPMDANFRRSEPGLSPMGMPLVPVYEEDDREGGAVRVSATVQQNLGLRVATVVRRDLSRELRTVGYTRWNEASLESLHTRAKGWLEELNLDSVGDEVRAGEVVYELFAPELVSAQREFLTALAADNPRLAALARDRLPALGFSAGQIARLQDTGAVSPRLVYRANRDAVVTAIGPREGTYVEPGTLIATLASLETVWVDIDVFASEAGLVRQGQAASISFPAFPGREWTGRVDYVYPELDPVTRTVTARLIIANTERLLRPNMFAHVALQVEPRQEVLVIPSEAVIQSQQGARVIMRDREGGFEARVVDTGIESNGLTEVIGGLREGEEVVTSGQFLLDAEANGEQAFARLQQAGTGQATADGAMDTADTTPARYSATGTILAIDEGQSILLSHGPVPALNWPAMTMSFSVAADVPLVEFDVDDRVDIVFRQLDSGAFQVVSLADSEVSQ
ncbi:MAG: efflux RND transporter periplasmic adaptor subunit [Pseudohongiellaceae bacterium]